MKRYLAEFIGTFGIVFAPVALSASGKLPGGDGSLLGAALVSGLIVLAMIFTFGPISAAHFNPAVTLGFASANRFPWRHVVPYWIAQFSGATVAAAVVALLFGAGSGVHAPSDPTNVLRNVGVEVVISFLLMSVIMALATDSRVDGAAPAIGIGLVVVVGVMIGGPVTGGSMNPARSLGPDLFHPESLGTIWIYFVGPCLGTMLGAKVYEAVRLSAITSKSAPADLP